MPAELLDDEDKLELRSKQNIDYRTVLMLHLGRISQISIFMPQIIDKISMHPDRFSQFLREAAIESLITSIKLLEGMLKPYLDKEYADEKAKIYSAIQGKTDSPYAALDAALEQFGQLMCLMCRRNLLLEERVTMIWK